MVLKKKIFKVFTIYFYMKTDVPRGGSQFDPGGHDLNNLGRGQLGNAACKISKL